MTVLIGSYSGTRGAGAGISVLDGDEVIAVVSADSPSWLARHPSLPVLYAVAEIDEGHVHAWALVGGAPAHPLGTGETGGAEPAHLTVDPSGRFLITANYTGGSISVHELGPDGSIGQRTDLVRHETHGAHPRQDAPHPHMILATMSELLVTDLGGDSIYRYRLTDDGQLRPAGTIATPPGSGPRHVLLVGDRAYVTAELSGQVLGYGASWELLGAVPASLSPGPNQPSELVSDGRYLYVANRGPNTVAVFALPGRSGGSSPRASTAGGSGGSSPRASTDVPSYITEVAAGDWPRHIALDGETLYVANERSHEVMRMRVDPVTGIPAHARTIEIPSPTIVLP